MNWLFTTPKSSGPLPPLNSLQQQRQRQIESLKTTHSNIAEIQKDVEYRLPFTVNNTTININIFLPPQFPQEKPVVTVYPPIIHHLVDKHNGVVITSPLLANFTMHSDLGKIIQSFVDDFWKNSPVLPPSNTFSYLYSNPSGIPPYPSQGFPFIPPYTALETRSATDSVQSATFSASRPACATGLISDLSVPVTASESPLQVGQNGCSNKMPDVPEAFPELSDLSVSDLQDLVDQNDLFKYSLQIPQLNQFATDKDDLLNSIEELAKKNLQLEPSLEAKREEILEKYEQLTQMKSLIEQKMQRQHELDESCCLSALQARLKVAAHEAEEESDMIAESFLDGKREIDEFLSSFMEKRMICHSRRAKEEKLQQVISKHSQFHTTL
ncbi:vacuolar protein sorting-associated protein 37A [Protopterus annectens]|uniref:vacuolar protein sorting-associated protein 37A n=1 Tax=Protopterus annectens TaxID=7888 RepID=UPI001CF992FF|nr:vacuolar protein sorting-associated protein 37A [Protopterus annectens]